MNKSFNSLKPTSYSYIYGDFEAKLDISLQLIHFFGTI